MSLSPPAQTLLLSPPSLSSHPERLNEILLSHDRSATDLQMLDRLALGFVSLPVSTYDTVLILADIDGSYSESSILAEPGVLKKIALSLKPGGHLLSQDGINGLPGDPYQTEAVLAGLISDDKGGFVKPDFGDQHSVPLRIGNKKESTEVGNGKRAIQELKMTTPAVPWSTHVKGTTVPGVGLVNFNDDFDAIANTSSDELIDEDGLLDNDDLARPIIQPPECRPKAGKRRRACKDCTCGLAQKLEEEDAERRNNADRLLGSMKLDRNDLAEVDFTVQGKVGSCGNCALGDAFRCDGCPYIGLLAFKPGEEVRLLNNDVQL